MDRYQRVEKPRTYAPIIENEIRITTQGRMRNYMTYVITLVQRRIAGLHQVTSIGSAYMTDMWEPLEEGLLPYQLPIPADQVKPLVEYDQEDGLPNIRGRGRGGRGKGRGNYNNGGGIEYNNGDTGWEGSQGYNGGCDDGRYFGGRGRGRGRGRGGFRGRGGYRGGAPPQEFGGYNDYRGTGKMPPPTRGFGICGFHKC